LRQLLEVNPFFRRLPEKSQRNFLKGRESHFEPLESIAERCGTPRRWYRIAYRLASNHAHVLLMSFYRMGEQERGRGIHSEIEEAYSKMFIEFVSDLMAEALAEMRALFTGVVKT
jgi:hypothetical protein